VGTFRNVVVTNIVAEGTSEIGCSITGLPGHRIENVSLENLSLGFDGGGTREEASKEVPERPDSYPESTMFGALPAYGFYVRHVKGLSLENVRLRTAQPDLRHALVCDDAEDVKIDGLDASSSPGAAAMVRLTQVRGALIRGCKPERAGTFLKLEGNQSRRVVLMENDLGNVEKTAEIAPDVPEGAFSESASRPAGRP
jgi:hypothetical protein